jgi:hypothetical protein
MKWIYITLGVLSGLAPAAYIYARLSSSPNYTGALIDPVLAIRSLVIGSPAIPLFAGAGLLTGALIHLGIMLLRRLLGRYESNGTLGHGASWVTRRPQESRHTRE